MPASLIAILLALQPAPPEIELRAGAWFARVSGSMKFDEKPAVGDRVDLVDDLGADRGLMPALQARLTLGADRFSLGAVRVLWESEETLDRARRWNESLFAAGEEARTRFDLFEGEIAYQRRFAVADTFDVWAGAVARYLRLEAVLRSPSQGRDDDHAITFAPAVRVDGRWSARADLRLEAGLEVSDLRTGEMDVRGGAGVLAAEWRPSEALSLRLGWRSEWLRLTKETSLERNDLRARFGGVTLGLEVRL